MVTEGTIAPQLDGIVSYSYGDNGMQAASADQRILSERCEDWICRL